MICVSIGNIGVDECIHIIKAAEMSEVRLDLMEVSDADIKRIFSSGRNILATCRHNDRFVDSDRIVLLEKAMQAGAAYVDIEVDSSFEFKKSVTEIAKKHKTKLIVSYHNVHKTPPREELEQIVASCDNPLGDGRVRVDVIKIACMSHSRKDNIRLISMLEHDKPMIIIGMGEKGRVTRFVAPLLGVFCTFVGMSELKTALGQPTKEELEKFLKGYNNTK